MTYMHLLDKRGDTLNIEVFHDDIDPAIQLFIAIKDGLIATLIKELSFAQNDPII